MGVGGGMDRRAGGGHPLTRKACWGGTGGGERSGLEWPLSRGWGGHGPALGSRSLLSRGRRDVWGEDRGLASLRERGLDEESGVASPGCGGAAGCVARDGGAASETPGRR